VITRYLITRILNWEKVEKVDKNEKGIIYSNSFSSFRNEVPYSLRFTVPKEKLQQTTLVEKSNSFLDELPIFAPNIVSLKWAATVDKMIFEKDDGSVDIAFGGADSNPYLVARAIERIIANPLSEVSKLDAFSDAHTLIKWFKEWNSDKTSQLLADTQLS